MKQNPSVIPAQEGIQRGRLDGFPPLSGEISEGHRGREATLKTTQTIACDQRTTEYRDQFEAMVYSNRYLPPRRYALSPIPLSVTGGSCNEGNWAVHKSLGL